MDPLTSPAARRLLLAIFEKTQGRNRGVRDVAELETGLTAEESRLAWRDLLGQGLIERFSLDYAARLSVKGIEFIQSGRLEDQPLRKVLIIHGHGTGARQAVATFLEGIAFQAILLEDQATMQQVETHDNVSFAVVLLTREDLGWTAGGTRELRPRLEVLMDIGYLIGRFGRAKVCAFAIECPTDLPADLAGVPLERFDSSVAWKSVLTRVLAA